MSHSEQFLDPFQPLIDLRVECVPLFMKCADGFFRRQNLFFHRRIPAEVEAVASVFDFLPRVDIGLVRAGGPRDRG